MTDNEIIANEILCIRRRASGRCNGGTDCNTCDLLMNEKDIISAYERAIANNDLINRQQAEIEKLKAEEDKYPFKCVMPFNSMICSKSIEDYDRLINDIGIDAIKGFVDRLKETAMQKFDWNEYVEVADIDNLVKEMVGTGELKNDQ